MSLIRFETTGNRGPSGKLWGNLVDWVKGTLKVDAGVCDVDDFAPFNAGSIIHSVDTGFAATEAAEKNGVVTFAASAGTYPVSGYQRRFFVDCDESRNVCMEATVQRTAGGTGAESSFVGFSNAATVAAVYAADGDVDAGDQLGLLWNDDLTVDLVLVDGGSVTTLIAEVATAVSNSSSHKFGVRTRKERTGFHTVIVAVDGVTKKVTSALVAALAPMKPTVANTISATDAPSFKSDWIATVSVD
jgi:hypothetical protein